MEVLQKEVAGSRREKIGANANASNGRKKPIWEVAQELSARIPDEEWAKVPSDLSTNLDHYLYDAPKSEE